MALLVWEFIFLLLCLMKRRISSSETNAPKRLTIQASSRRISFPLAFLMLVRAHLRSRKYVGGVTIRVVEPGSRVFDHWGKGKLVVLLHLSLCFHHFLGKAWSVNLIFSSTRFLCILLCGVTQHPRLPLQLQLHDFPVLRNWIAVGVLKLLAGC